MKTFNEIVENLKELGFKEVEYLGEWKGYRVHAPIIELGPNGEIPVIGLPLYILENDEGARLTDETECFEVMNYFDK